MPANALSASQLRLTIDPTSLGFASTAELQDLPCHGSGKNARRLPHSSGCT